MVKNKRRKGQQSTEPAPLLLARARLPATKNASEAVEKASPKLAATTTITTTAAIATATIATAPCTTSNADDGDDIIDEEASISDFTGASPATADQSDELAAENAAALLSLDAVDTFAATRAVLQSKEYAVLHLREEAQLSLAGSLSLLCLHGTCVVNGAQLGKGDQSNIAAPAWSAAAVLNVLCNVPWSHSRLAPSETAVLVRKLLSSSPAQKDDACVVAITTVEVDYKDVTSLDVNAAGFPEQTVQRLQEMEEKSRVCVSVLLHSDFRVMTAYAARALKLPYLSIAPSWENLAAAMLAGNKSDQGTKVVICGPKGAGKSTCVRYLINRMLSECPVVAVLDCDVGQPEFNTPGIVSLHFITAAVLDLPHHHIRTPLRSYLIGDVATKNDPLLFAACVRALSQLYHEVYSVIQFTKTTSDLDNLAAHEATQLESILHDVAAWRSPTAQSTAPAIPLLVNTDGWIRAMGSDVLGAVLDLVNPTILGRLGESNRIPPLLCVPPGGCQLFDLQSTVNAQSRAVPAELRTLRWTTYFTQNVASKPTFIVRSGQLLDSDANLARLIISAPSLRIPFQNLKLRVFASQLAPAMMLAAFNAALVMIVHDTRPVGSTPVQLSCSDPRMAEGQTHFALDCMGELSPAATCIGFGIVRAIDLCTQCLYLYTPVDKQLLREQAHNIYLVLSELSTPQQFLYFPGAPSHAYFSSDVTGEGAATIRSRGTTIKRKSSQR